MLYVVIENGFDIRVQQEKNIRIVNSIYCDLKITKNCRPVLDTPQNMILNLFEAFYGKYVSKT